MDDGMRIEAWLPGAARDPAETAPFETGAARILFEAFKAQGKDGWPSPESALDEVRECLADAYLCIGVRTVRGLAGWAGLRPMYEKTWELHPMVVASGEQGRGIGRFLLAALEAIARELGLDGIVLGTDDDTGSTSLSQVSLNGANLFGEVGTAQAYSSCWGGPREPADVSGQRASAFRFADMRVQALFGARALGALFYTQTCARIIRPGLALIHHDQHEFYMQCLV